MRYIESLYIVFAACLYRDMCSTMYLPLLLRIPFCQWAYRTLIVSAYAS